LNNVRGHTWDEDNKLHAFEFRRFIIGFPDILLVERANPDNVSGLATSGTTGDCQFAEYFHEPGVFSGTCEVSLNLMAENGAPAWQEGSNGDWFFSGTAVTHPASQTGFCASLPGSPAPTFSDFDSLIPVAVGHINASGFFGTTELQIQETPLK
jgi:hypothetical protein